MHLAVGMSCVIVTGCNSFIGRATAHALASDYQVIGFDDLAPKMLGPLVEFMPVDFKDDGSVRAGLAHVAGRYGRRLASVIHLASYCDFSGEPSPLYEQVTIRGTERLLKNIEEALEVEQFVFPSTMLVHGPTRPGAPIRETSPIQPKWDYPRSQWETEELVRKRGTWLRHVILRIAGLYDDGCHSVPLANQMRRIFERKLMSHVFPGVTEQRS